MENIKVNKFGILLVVSMFMLSLFVVFLQAANDAPDVFHGGDETNWGFSAPQYNRPGSYRSFSGSQASTYWPILANREQCEATSDFVMFIRPGGCTPTVVRSDLLEEQNVPVFCKVDVVKINPLIDVSQLKSVRFKGQYGKYIAGVNFHPNAEAIYSNKNDLDNPLINDAGYVVVILKRIAREDDMPESVKINLTGVLRYDAQNFFGSDTKNYYLNVMEDNDWTANNDYKENTFFKGRGYLRADWVDGNKAKISIYRDKEHVLNSFILEKGQTSRTYYIPGFYCRAGVKVRLDSIEAGVERVKLEVDDNQIKEVNGEGVNKKEVKSVKLVCKGKSKTLSYSDTIIEKKDGAVDGEDVTKQLENIPLEELEREIFKEAKMYAEDIEAFYGAIEVKGEVLSAKALYRLGVLAQNLNQNAIAQELFVRVQTDYPDSVVRVQTDYPDSVYANSADLKMTHLEAPATEYGQHNIRLLEIEVPKKQDASASFSITKKGNNEVLKDTAGIQKDEIFADGNFQLKRLISSDEVEVYFSGSGEKKEDKETFRLTRGSSEIKGDYIIRLVNINLTEIAKVSLISEVPRAYSESDFLFEIGIEKRAIQLSPKKAQERIDNLNKQIEKFESIVLKLGNFVKGMKAACFTTSAALIVKNMITGLSGQATARQEVMPMWYKECERLNGKNSVEFNKCLNEKEKIIEDDIKKYSEVLDDVNDEIIEIQKDNKVTGGSAVDRKKAADAFRVKYGFDVEKKYCIEYVEPVSEKQGGCPKNNQEEVTISKTQFEKLSLTDLRDLELNQRIINSGISDTGRQAAQNKINSVVKRVRNIGEDTDLYTETGFGWLNSASAKYYLRGDNKDKVYTAPIPKTYIRDKDGEKQEISGFYVVVDEGGYRTSGDVKEFWIQNIGNDKIRDISGDEKIFINYATDYKKRGINQWDLTEGQFDRLVEDGLQVIKISNRNSGQRKFGLFGHNVIVDLSGEFDEKRCQDFMNPADCKLLFNICDPVICPSSRCDLGGKYRVDNVIQSGIIGSIALCLPNAGEVAIPVCVSGIHAGLDAYLSILKSYRGCLEENLETGRTVGICDEVHSIYLCEFFWRQAAPFLDTLLISMLESAQGQGMKGGGEYLTVQDAWKNAEDSIDFLKKDYAVNSYNAFQVRSTQDVGTEFCKMFVSAKVPNKGIFDNLIEPDSPVQFHAWFDEIPYSEATVPATSQYKVFYHIWAGRDIGANYQIYLRSPDKSSYISVQETIVVDTNFIPKAGYVSETRDFTAPAGYKELCIRINGKDECGFKRVSTSFALDYASDKFYEDQLKQEIQTKDECVTGSPSAYALVSPNIQEGAQNVLTPDLDKKGITRICAKENPGRQTEQTRWKDVGFCDDESLRCWVDTYDVKDVITNKGISDEIITTEDTSKVDYSNIADSSDIKNVFDNIDNDIKKIDKAIKDAKDKRTIISNIFSSLRTGTPYNNINLQLMIRSLEEISQKAQNTGDRAMAVYKKFRIFEVLGKGIIGAKKQMSDKVGGGSDKLVDDGRDVVEETDEEKATKNPKNYIYRYQDDGGKYIFYKYDNTDRKWKKAVLRSGDVKKLTSQDWKEDNSFLDADGDGWKTPSEGLVIIKTYSQEIDYIEK